MARRSVLLSAALVLSLGLAGSAHAVVQSSADLTKNKGTELKIDPFNVAFRLTREGVFFDSDCIGFSAGALADNTIVLTTDACLTTLSQFTLIKTTDSKTAEYQILVGNTGADDLCLQVTGTGAAARIVTATCDSVTIRPAQLFTFTQDKSLVTIKSKSLGTCLQAPAALTEEVTLAACDKKVTRQQFFITSLLLVLQDVTNNRVSSLGEFTLPGPPANCWETPSITSPTAGVDPITVVPCDPTTINQVLQGRPVSSDEDDKAKAKGAVIGPYYAVRRGNVCLGVKDVRGDQDKDDVGANLLLSTCNKNNLYQHLALLADGRIRVRETGLCLSNLAGEVTQEDCDITSVSQQWIPFLQSAVEL